MALNPEEQLKSTFSLRAKQGLRGMQENNTGPRENYFQRLLENSAPETYFCPTFGLEMSQEFTDHLAIQQFGSSVDKGEVDQWIATLVKIAHQHIFDESGNFQPKFEAFLTTMFAHTEEFNALTEEKKKELFSSIRKDILLSVVAGSILACINSNILELVKLPDDFEKYNQALKLTNDVINQKWNTNPHALADAASLSMKDSSEIKLRSQISKTIDVIDDAIDILAKEKVQNENIRGIHVALQSHRDALVAKIETRDSLLDEKKHGTIEAILAGSTSLISKSISLVNEKEKEQLSGIKAKLNTLFENIVKLFKGKEFSQKSNSLFFKSNDLKTLEKTAERLDSQVSSDFVSKK